MAALCDGFTLCGLASGPSSAEARILGIEQGREADHVIVTDARKSITVYKVSDQKPLGSWTVKQGQTITSPAVYNTQTGEYVVVTDNKVIRVWKDEDCFDKAFKATVSADVARVHALPDSEPVVLFARGAVRILDTLLAVPQQSIEELLPEGEIIRWSESLVKGKQKVVIFTTEQKGEHFVYLHRFNPNSLLKYKLEMEDAGGRLLSVSAAVQNKNIRFLYLSSRGCLYQSEVPVSGGAAEGVQTLPRTLLLNLPAGDGHLSVAAVLSLDEASVAVVGVPHPCEGPQKEFLCIWNTHFQTLQACRELPGQSYGQLWCFSGKLYVPHGRLLTAVPYDCQRTSLAAALGRLKQGHGEGSCPPPPVRSWNSLLHEAAAQPQRSTRRSKLRKSQAAAITVDQVLEDIKTAPGKDVKRQVESFLGGAAGPDLQLGVGQVASQLVARCLCDPSFYTRDSLARLVHTRCLSHSVCPGLLPLVLEKKDYSLIQLCLQHFPDIPEEMTCACLKAFIDVSDGDLEAVDMEPESMSLMENISAGWRKDGTLENGFSPVLLEDDVYEAQIPPSKSGGGAGFLNLDVSCPVGLKKAVLLNEILQTAHTESSLLPHLKDLSVQQVLLFLRYLWFLYLKFSQDVNVRRSGLRSPTTVQIIDWVCLVLDAHFTVLVMVPEAKDVLSHLNKFVKSQVRLISELGKIQGSLLDLRKLEQSEDVGLYSIEIIELF
ncbi:nucleolar protein 11-like [Brienomyrus brachyistius]|uniref:nucleolar protein 11-like n=1 Tax=Brienomyrus brachyistius TaxID=42636 RepID=UPI0020B428E0|nr:nucleolar protein 11-like [Brienomyrus brachyistius]